MKFKSKPEDFVVEEVSNLKPKKEGEYLYVLLKKREWTTARAIRTISKRLRVSKVRVGFSGNKDKNAITTQIISLWRIKKEQVERLKIKDIDLTPLGYGNDRINLGDHERNHFKIKLRSLTKKELDSFEKQFPIVKKFGFPNYFGGQRFGQNENSHLIGKAIIQGDFERAVKRLLGKNPGKNWKRQLEKIPKGKRMERAVLDHLIKFPNDYAGALRLIEKPTRRLFVHAYQSWIFNKALSELLSGDGVKFIDLNLKFPSTKSDVSGKLPILGTNIKLGKDKLSKAYASVLKDEGIKLEDFACKSMPELASEGSERSAFVQPEKLKVEKSKTTIILSFELEKGSYATTFLSSLFLRDIK